MADFILVKQLTTTMAFVELEPVTDTVEYPGGSVFLLEDFFTDDFDDEDRAEQCIYRLATDPAGQPAISAELLATLGGTVSYSQNPADEYEYLALYAYPNPTPEQLDQEGSDTIAAKVTAAEINILNAAEAAREQQVDATHWQYASNARAAGAGTTLTESYLDAADIIYEFADGKVLEFAEIIQEGGTPPLLTADDFPDAGFATLAALKLPMTELEDGDETTRLRFPWGIRRSNARKGFVVADYLNNKVKLLSDDGAISSLFEVTRPGGVDVLADGAILVAVNEGESIQRYTDEGGLEVLLDDRARFARGVAIDETNDRLYVCDRAGRFRLDVYEYSTMTHLRMVEYLPAVGTAHYELQIHNGRCFSALARLGNIVSLGPDDTAFAVHATGIPPRSSQYGFSMQILPDGAAVVGQANRLIRSDIELDPTEPPATWQTDAEISTNQFVFGIDWFDEDHIIVTNTLRHQILKVNNALTTTEVIGGSLAGLLGDVDSSE